MTRAAIHLADGLGNRADIADIPAPASIGWDSVEFTMANGRQIRVELVEAGRVILLFVPDGQLVFVPLVSNRALVAVDALGADAVIAL